MNWIHGEEGPDCFCGNPTIVWIIGERASLICLFHTPKEGASFPLPAEKPDTWPNLTNEEMEILVQQGMKEHYNT